MAGEMSDEARQVLDGARALAQEKGHGVIDPVHVAPCFLTY